VPRMEQGQGTRGQAAPGVRAGHHPGDPRQRRPLAQLQVDKPQTLPVAEVFGPTIQGEGPHAGRRCWFLRLGECNLHCAWCDTKFTWDWDNHQREAELEDLTMPEIVGRLRDKGARHGDVVVLTGGEPLIHYNRPAFRALVETGYRWHLESNGTIWPGDKVANAFAHVTLSVKVAQEDDPEKRRIKPGAIARWPGSSWSATGRTCGTCTG
jgi:7-carboxy-7-deazaguanine synthase